MANEPEPPKVALDAIVPAFKLWLVEALIVPPVIVPDVKFTLATVSEFESKLNVPLSSTVKFWSSGNTFEADILTVVLEPEITVLMLSWVVSFVSMISPIVWEAIIIKSPWPLTFPVWLDISVTFNQLLFWINILPAPLTLFILLFSFTYNLEAVLKEISADVERAAAEFKSNLPSPLTLIVVVSKLEPEAKFKLPLATVKAPVKVLSPVKL